MANEKKRRRGALVPELELPAILHAALREYLGRRHGKLTEAQRADLVKVAQRTADDVALVLRGEPLPDRDRGRVTMRIEEREPVEVAGLAL